MTKKQLLSVLAAGIFLCGIVLMLLVVPSMNPGTTPTEPDDVSITTTEDDTSVFVTDPPTDPPTEPPTEPPTYPPAETMPPETLSLTAEYGFAYDCSTQRFLYIGGDPEAPLANRTSAVAIPAYFIMIWFSITTCDKVTRS